MTNQPMDPAVASYLAAAPEPGLAAYEQLTAIVRSYEPDVEVRISYGIPTYFVGGKRLLHTGIWADHLAIYPIPDGAVGDPSLVDDLAAYRHGKGTLRFLYADPWPQALVERVVRAHLARIGRL